MNKLILALALLATLPAHSQEVKKTTKVSDIYKQGMIAMDEGNVKAADAAFREVLRINPGHADARHQLSELNRNQGSIAARAREKQLKEYEISEINFDKVELSEALAALAMLTEKKSGGKFAPNFMVQDPSNQLTDAKVTLMVKNVPAKAAFDMILQQTGTVAKYEQHAIVVKPVAKSK